MVDKGEGFRLRKLLGLVAVLAMVAAGCAGDDVDDPGDDAPPGPDATEDPAEGGHDPDAVLRVLTSIAPQHYDPVTGTFPCDIAELALIYDTLVRQNPDGTVSPGLAASWSSPDEVTFELTLQEGVTFQDGTPFDAEAVVAHFERAGTHALSSVREQLAFIESAEAVDEHTVRLSLTEARGGVLPAILTGRAGMVPSPAAVEAAGDAYGSEQAVGAGPYWYVEHTPGEHLRVERWDGYWDPDVQLLGGIEHFGISAQFQIERLRSGELDYVALNDDELPAVEAAADEGVLDYVVSTSPQYMHIFINFAAEPFDDVLVRQALNHAIDREAVNDVLTGGVGTVAWGPLPSDSWGRAEAVESMYPFDPDRARELLAEAGFADGLTFEAGAIQIPLYQRAAEVLQDMLRESGITMELVPVTGAEINEKLYVTGELAAAVTAFSAPRDPGLTLEARYGSQGANNPAGSSIEGLDELLARGAASDDETERADLYQEAELMVMEAALDVPIYHFAGLVAHRPEVRNVVRGYPACAGANYLSPPLFVAAE